LSWGFEQKQANNMADLPARGVQTPWRVLASNKNCWGSHAKPPGGCHHGKLIRNGDINQAF